MSQRWPLCCVFLFSLFDLLQRVCLHITQELNISMSLKKGERHLFAPSNGAAELCSAFVCRSVETDRVRLLLLIPICT